jgi:CxxC motif-containing protein (DUF1111 family)
MMNAISRHFPLAVLAVLAGGTSVLAQQPDGPAAAMIDAGRALFERQWVAGEASQPGVDGLGPVFNHVSCAACHKQGGLGGAGPIDVNASMVSVEVPKLAEAPQRKAFMAALKSVHSGFLSADGKIRPNLILHRFGVDKRYAALRRSIVGTEAPFQPTQEQREELQRELSRLPVRPVAAAAPLKLAVTQRNTPALFGARQIDAIPDATLHAIAAVQSKHSEVSGRVAQINLTKAGRFGWRGQIEHLHDFVLGACANEMGLEVSGNSQPADPFLPEYKPSGQDLSAAQCLSLTSFVASLDPPKFVKPEHPEKQDLVDRGRKVFQNVGCATCHVENIGPVKEIFSDLLLHDMGPGLADPAGAQPTMVQVSQVIMNADAKYEQEGTLINDGAKKLTQVQVPYYGGVSRPVTMEGVTTYETDRGITTLVPSSPTDKRTMIKTKYEPLGTNLAQEWRTPPLWGLADSAPYLHDGRAATVLEAIALHGGEAEKTTARFLALDVGDRLAVLEFLSCLKAP